MVNSADRNHRDVIPHPVVPIIQFSDPRYPENSFIEDGGIARTMEREHRRDTALDIKRPHIPFQIILLPNSPQGVRCREIFERFDQLIDSPLVPNEPNLSLSLMLRCIQQKWQIRFLWLAHDLCDRPVPDLVDRHLRHLVTQSSFAQLKLEVPYDLALYRLLQAGEDEIRHWCQQNQISYPFATPFELFLEILQEEFAASLEHCFSFTPFCTNQRQREDEHRLWTAFLNDRFWDGGEKNTKYKRSNQAIEDELIAVLKASNWQGRAVLALWQQKAADHLKAPWKTYRQAYKQLIPLITDEITYIQDQPTITGTTSHRIPITGEITPEGYIAWTRS